MKKGLKKSYLLSKNFKMDNGNMLVFSDQMIGTAAPVISAGGARTFQLSIVNDDRKIVKKETYRASNFCNICDAAWLLKLKDRYFTTMVPNSDRKDLKIYEINTETLELSETNKNLKNFDLGKNGSIFTRLNNEAGFYLRGALVKEKKGLFLLSVYLYDDNLNLVFNHSLELPIKENEVKS
jgi:hypothetical protein